MMQASSGSYRLWSRREHAVLEALVEEGESFATIARRLRRSRHAVLIKAGRRGLTHPRTGATLSALGVARLLGISHHVVCRWLREGWLPARPSVAGSAHPKWRVTEEAFDAFLADPAYFMLWEAEAITDPALRAWAREERAAHPGWLTLHETGRRLGITTQAVRCRIYVGTLPAAKRGMRWYVHETTVAGGRAS